MPHPTHLPTVAELLAYGESAAQRGANGLRGAILSASIWRGLGHGALADAILLGAGLRPV